MSAQAEAAAKRGLRYVDDRLGSASFLRRSMNKVFPDHWSFLLGEIAMYSLIILLLTGVYLTLFFHASSQEVIYHGRYAPLRGVAMTDAYASTLHLSFDVRGGLLVRQIHHWAALLFVLAIITHLFRVFFTGAFRKPRTLNWHVGTVLLILAILEGFAGYSLPDDLLSGTGIRIAYSVMESIPLVGSYAAYLVFGGNFPGVDFIPRLFVIHVLLVPGIIIALFSAHMMMIWHQKHTDFPGPGKTEHNVVGTVFFPTFMLKTTGFLFLVFGVLTLMAAFLQINPVWLYGPYNPSQVSAGSQPDFYIFFLEGSLRLMPNWETTVLGHTISWNILIPGVILPGIMFNLLAMYPAIESWATKDKGFHNLLQRPRDVPVRTALGVMALTFYGVLFIGGQNDVLARTFDWSLQATSWTLRVLLIALPPIAFYITKRWCLGLQRHDEELLHHGIETGIIRRLPSGEYIEVTAPLPPQRAAILAMQLGVDHDGHSNGHAALSSGNGAGTIDGEPEATKLRKPVGPINRARDMLEGFFFERGDAPKPNPEDEEPKTLTR
ncbi:MAG: ubiquinol-cytochrome c reductase cytochrome b subunit [Frankiaceae bacterium]|jgi:ubiquinol-cytochrome c reductase cytochrome b subunit|nr:ubiquinol-cytochrome c reductase cytochrome b subunit [Frankiaceae bacterium]